MTPRRLRQAADDSTMLLVARKAKQTAAPGMAKRKADVLGRSPLTGTRVLRPASKGATVSVREVRSALRSLGASAAK